MSNQITSIGIVDDHQIFRMGLKLALDRFPNFNVVLEAENGVHLQQLLPQKVPDILILDLKMPVMDGYETLNWLKDAFPDLPVIILSMCDTDMTIRNLLKSGARAVVKKNIEAEDLERVIYDVINYGYSIKDPGMRNLLLHLKKDHQRKPAVKPFSEKEWQFLRLIGTKLTYVQIAGEIGISCRAVDKIRDTLFQEFDEENRTALAVRCARNGII